MISEPLHHLDMSVIAYRCHFMSRPLDQHNPRLSRCCSAIWHWDHEIIIQCKRHFVSRLVSVHLRAGNQLILSAGSIGHQSSQQFDFSSTIWSLLFSFKWRVKLVTNRCVACVLLGVMWDFWRGKNIFCLPNGLTWCWSFRACSCMVLFTCIKITKILSSASLFKRHSIHSIWGKSLSPFS